MLAVFAACVFIYTWSMESHIILSTDRRPRAYPLLVAAGADLFAFWDTADALFTRTHDNAYQLVTRDPRPVVLFEAPQTETLSASEVDWLDFTIELIAGMVALFTGIRIGRDGYLILKPVTEALWQDPGVQIRVRSVGSLTQEANALAVGKGVIELWRYLWTHHKSTIFKGVLRAIGRELRPRALLEALVRWMARLISAGVALTIEIGLLIMPLGRKLRRRRS